MYKIILFLLCINVLSANDPKTLVLIISSCNRPVYPKFEKIWEQYMNSDPDHFECYFIKGDPEIPTLTKMENNTIWSKTEECIVPGILNKTLMTLEALYPRMSEFDFVVRTNLSSFFIFPRLLEFLKQAPKEKYYCGIRHGMDLPGFETGWICGAGIIISSDLVKLILANKRDLLNLNCDKFPSGQHYRAVDDVAIAELFVKHGVPLQLSKHVEIFSIFDWLRHKDSIPDDVFHIRVQTPEPLRSEIDPFIHRTFFNDFYGKPDMNSLPLPLIPIQN